MPLVSPFERMAEERGLQQGLERGLQQGLERGLQQLQQRIERDKELIIRQLIKKLGTINEALQTQVKALNIDDLETLAEDLFDMDSIDDLQQWLNKFNDN
jgi:flagellar biosynthesis/type III secretory pathway protein FliH